MAPILFICYRRPEQTKSLWETIKKASPNRLYIATDGPKVGEEQKCSQVLEIIYDVDWACEVFRLHSSINQGCGIAVSKAISWFFEHEDSGIILEDDTLPHPDFFTFCNNLLLKYANDKSIMMISGNNKNGYVENGCSYDTIKLCNIWGWATWKRAWLHFDYDMKNLENLKNNDYFIEAAGNLYQHKISQYQKTFDGKIDSWGYRWECSVLSHRGKCIIPSRNLIMNIGFGHGATHTNDIIPEIYNSLGNGIEFPLTHPLCK